jgi:hypothetical protein
VWRPFFVVVERILNQNNTKNNILVSKTGIQIEKKSLVSKTGIQVANMVSKPVYPNPKNFFGIQPLSESGKTFFGGIRI